MPRRDISECAYDGAPCESLGWGAAQSEHLFAQGDFRHAYWSPGWVVAIAMLYEIFGRRPIVVRILPACYAARPRLHDRESRFDRPAHVEEGGFVFQSRITATRFH
jgi:hypothetical protein